MHIVADVRITSESYVTPHHIDEILMSHLVLQRPVHQQPYLQASISLAIRTPHLILQQPVHHGDRAMVLDEHGVVDEGHRVTQVLSHATLADAWQLYWKGKGEKEKIR